MRLAARVGSAAVLLAVLAGVLLLGGPAVDVLLGVAAGIGLYEVSGLAGRCGAPPPWWLIYPLGEWLVFRFLLPASVPAMEIGLGSAVAVGLIGVLVLSPERGPARWAAGVGGALYVGLTLGYYLALLHWHPGPDADRFGLRIVGVVLVAVFAGDTAALFAGSRFGRHRFFPRISPRKTVEGALGGAVASIAVVAAGAPWLFGLDRLQAVGLGAAVAVASQAGDLAESALKRAAGAKDSSDLIPGHGGLLDRLDSLLLVGPVVYCFLRLVTLP